MTWGFEVPFKQVEHIVRMGFAGAKSRRTVKFVPATAYATADYWSEGSITYSVFVDLLTGRTLSASDIPASQRQVQGNPCNLPIATVTLSPNHMVVTSIIFCGKNLGYRIHLHPDVYGALQRGLESGTTTSSMQLVSAVSALLPATTA